MVPFFEKLAIISQRNNSLLCVGLDPEPPLGMDEFDRAEFVFSFNQLIIAATAGLICAYKPNLAIYESMGHEGIRALEKTLDAIHESDPDVQIIGDAKRNDIGNCSLAYVKTLYDNFKFDAVTGNPYMGYDSLQPFFERKDKGVFVLCRTSNSGGKDLQDLMVVGDGDSSPQPLYQKVARLVQTWDEHGNVGLVLGATYPQEIYQVRQISPHMNFLIPGIGPQGGDLAATVSSAVNAEGTGFIINATRMVMNGARDSSGKLRKSREAQKEGMRIVARRLRDDINKYREQHVPTTSVRRDDRPQRDATLVR